MRLPNLRAPTGWLLAAGLIAVTLGGTLSSLEHRLVRLEVGGFEGGLRGDWSRGRRARVPALEARDGRTDFYYRAAPLTARIEWPLRFSGDTLRVTLRAGTGVRTVADLHVNGERLGDALIRPGEWDRYPTDVRPPTSAAEGVDLALVLRAEPLDGNGADRTPELLLDYLELQADRGLRFRLPVVLMAAAAPLLAYAFALIVGLSPPVAFVAALLLGAVVGGSGVALPIALANALPRLLLWATGAGLLAYVLLGRHAWPVTRDRGALAALVAVGVVAHGSVVFMPNHNPPDIDIHVKRAWDLGEVPWDYGEWLRYGSQLPTPSQDHGEATAALGEATLIPYSPLPYVVYFGAHRLGVDLYWALTVINATAAMLVAPIIFLFVRRVWSREAAWLAAALYSLDLAVWHHVGRSHAPAVIGAALGTAALAYLTARAGEMDQRRVVAAGATLLALAALGYSSLVVLLGLSGLVLLVLLAADAKALTPAARRGVAAAVVCGGLLAGISFYFHYVPGLLHGAASVEAEPDLFPGRAFFIFHNESRQSLRLWRLGYWIPLLLGLLAAPLALRRARPTARPVLVAWLAGWVAIMLLKQDTFPKLLRWAKEDQFLSPLLAALVAGAVWALPCAWLRWVGTAAVLGAALWLQLRDFAHHANSLRL